jgi:hypothetical protein
MLIFIMPPGTISFSTPPSAKTSWSISFLTEILTSLNWQNDGIIGRWREIRACNDNACGESKSQNFHESLLDLTFLIASTDPKASIY